MERIYIQRIYKGIQGINTTRVNMGAQDIKGYTGYTVLLRVNIGTEDKQRYTCVQGIQYYQGKHGCTGDVEVYMVYSMAKVNMGTQDM